MPITCRNFASGCLSFLGMLVSRPVLADETAPPSDLTVSGNVTVVSQYRFRGIAQSDNKPAAQASLGLAHSSGFYVTAWASSAQAGQGPIDIGGSEFDLAAGFTREIGTSGLTADIGATGYFYPDAGEGNYFEIAGSLAGSLGPATAKLGVSFVPAQKVFNLNWTSPTRHNFYAYGEIASDIPGTPLSLHSHLGHTGGGFDYAKPYFDYSIGATLRWKAFSLDASLVGTDISRADIATAFWPRYAGTGNCTSAADCTRWFHRMAGTTGVVTVSAGF